MLTSMLWFLAGSLCAALLLAGRARRPAPPRVIGPPRSRRAWLDRASAMGAGLPDPALAERSPAGADAWVPADRRSVQPGRAGQLTDAARRALHPAFGIRIRVRD